MFRNLPVGTVLVHACNCQGYWGAGVAAAFRQRYPASYEVYKQYCNNGQRRSDLLGTTLLIASEKEPMIGCLFTSVNLGAKKSDRGAIVKATGTAMTRLYRELQQITPPAELLPGHREIRMPRINSGLFGVPWADTEAELTRVAATPLGLYSQIVVFDLPKKGAGGGLSTAAS